MKSIAFEEKYSGLSKAEVESRIQQGLTNKPVESPSKPVRRIIFENVVTFFNIIFIVLGVLLILVGSYTDLVFLAVIIINTTIGITQEMIAKKQLDGLLLVAETTATVIRDGKQQVIPISSAVKDDLVIFKSGHQVFADAVVVDGNVSINESLITGESDEIAKVSEDSLLSGSFVVSGTCLARLTQVGAESYISKLTLEAKKNKKKSKPKMLRSIDRLLYVIGIIIAPVGILLYLMQTMSLGMTVKEGVSTSIAAIVGMIPQGLYLLISIALAASVGRLAVKKTLVKEQKCTETLARVDVLCVDKTGTITESEMKLAAVKGIRVDGNGELFETDEDSARELLKEYASVMDGDNQTMIAIQKYFDITETRPAEKAVPFSSEKKYSMCCIDGKCYALGAPDIIMGSGYTEIKSLVDSRMNNGFRTLLLAECEGGMEGAELISAKPVALVMLHNPVRESAKSTFKFFADNEVAIKVISGDSPLTVCAAAVEAGIVGADNYVDATELDTEEKIIEAAEKYTVFGRVKPNQKRSLVKALQAAGHVVAMTGDGVNDILALKEADCSIAMASGSDVAAQVSDIVLVNSDFSTMPDVVAEGRRVINNTQRAAALFLAKNIFSLILALVAIIMAVPFPITTAQLMISTYLTIGIPCLVFALEPNHELVRGHFLPNVIYKAMPGALTNFIFSMIILGFGEKLALDSDMVSTMTALLLAAIGFIMVYDVGRIEMVDRHGNKVKKSKEISAMRRNHFLLFVVIFFLLFVMVEWLPWFFKISKLNNQCTIIYIVCLCFVPACYYLIKRLSVFIYRLYKKLTVKKA